MCVSPFGFEQRQRPMRTSVTQRIEALEVRTLLSTFSVFNTNDAGAGSLRQAIIDANTTSGADTIDFNIGAGGVQTIALTTSALPTITEQVTIDATTQPGYAGTPIIELRGDGVGVVPNG